MNLIFSAASGYSPEVLRPFLESIRRFLSPCTLVLLVQAEDGERLQPLLARYPFLRFEFLESRPPLGKVLAWLRLLPLGGARRWAGRPRSEVPPEARTCIERGLNPALSRYFRIERLLTEPWTAAAQRIMLADSRDIVFQGDAFSLLDNDFDTGAEPGTLGPRDRWVGSLYGREGQAFLYRRQVYCSGFSVGSAAAVRRYVSLLCDELWSRLPKAVFHRGLDQAAHLLLLHKGRFQARIHPNFEGRIATISLEASTNLQVEPHSGLVRVHGKLPCVLHQYDRHPEIAAAVRRVFDV